MLWSGSSPLSVVRDGMWGFLLFAGVAWLAIAWSVLRLEPAGVADVAGPVILFGAVTEVLRALAGTRTWWLNAGMAVLFAATGVIMMADGGGAWTTPAALIGWYLMVRGAADLAISMLTRESDRIWGLLMVVGVAEIGLGFFAASSFARTAEMVIVILGGAALARAVADLVAALRLREVSVAARAERLLELTPERAIGVAGYSAGLSDFEAGQPERSGRARHRAMPRTTTTTMAGQDASGPVPGTQLAAPEGYGAQGSQISGPLGSQISGAQGSQISGTQGSQISVAQGSGAQIGGAQASGQVQLSDEAQGSFHDEVLRTTADLDAMLALAGVTGAAVPGAAARAAADEQVEVPDTAEGAEVPAPEEVAHASAVARRQGPAQDDGSLPSLDAAARAAETASPGMDDTAIIARSRMVD
ncbi:HdeD family acid-resistance protein [Actinoplanes friuliensis]|uniref:DUF308 domain-containing protein n=1 Tax=Actinoplanes friuliensis DSM 7358 TaxID=1246995 RepID=U5VU16_9ACTN|nr:hypothetical protein [Actinoplanes friuliensis]AGZ40364.1 hypothetical protein AFR_10375 [Actinoplanes friuliensis DSM 7358]